jgi:hypothetical protein
MLAEHVRRAQHIIVEEQQYVVPGLGGGAVAGGGGAAIGLLDHAQREGRLHLPQRFGCPVGRSVHDDDHFDRAVIARPRERFHGGANRLPPLISRNQDGEGRERLVTQRASPAMSRK